jgi:diguanylate cyclase (GGDEF)-like protein
MPSSSNKEFLQAQEIIQALGKDYSGLYFLNLDQKTFQTISSKPTTVPLNQGIDDLISQFTILDQKELHAFLGLNHLYSINDYHIHKGIFEKLVNSKKEYFELRLYRLKKDDEDTPSPFLLSESPLSSSHDKENYHLLVGVKSTLASERLVNDAFSSFSNESIFFNDSVNEMLEKIGSFYSCDRAYIMKVSNERVSISNEWHKPGVTSQRSNMQNMPIEYLDFAQSTIKDKHGLYLGSIEGLKEDFPLNYELLSRDKVSSIAVAPILTNGVLYGFIALDNPPAQHINNMSTILLAIANRFSNLIIDQRVQQELNTDPLTGLPSIAKANLIINHLLKDVKPEHQYVLVKFDLVQFYLINNYYGFKYADNFLRKIGQFLINESPEVKVASHTSNTDVFYMLLDQEPSQVEKSCLSKALQFSAENAKTKLNFTFGAYTIRDPNESYESIVSKASLALATVKEKKNKPFMMFNKELEDKAKHEQEVLNSFSGAIENKDFEIYIQPKADLTTGCIIGGEALVRWIKDGKVVLPNDFIPILEANGLISTLDNYVIVNTLKIIRSWLDQELVVVPISINISRADFYNDTLISNIVSIIDSFAVPHSLVEIEITESAYVEEQEHIVKFIEQCKQAGIKVLMDDFGSGYSSLNSLKDIDFDVVKLDYLFLKKSKDEIKRNSIITSLVHLCKSIDLPIIVEGVEDSEDASFLQRIGVRYIQGFLIGKPMPATEFVKLEKHSFSLPKFLPKDRELMEELFNPRSRFTTFFDNSLLYLGLFFYSLPQKKLILVMQNKRLANSDLAHKFNIFGKFNDFSQYFPSYELETINSYLKDVIEGKNMADSVPCSFNYDKKIVSFRLRATLVEKVDSGYLLLFEIAKENVTSTISNEKTFLSSDLDFIYGELSSPIVGIDYQNNVTYLNKSAKRSFSNVKIGSKCSSFNCSNEDCKDCPIKFSTRPTTNYNRKENRFYYIFSQQIILNGDSTTIAELKPIQEPTNGKGYSISERMAIAMQGIISAYMEVDLETGKYRKYEFDNRSFDIPSEGDYDDIVNEICATQLDPTFTSHASKLMCLEYLREANKKKERYQVRLKKRNASVWIQDTITFNVDVNGKDCASICIQDITSEVLKDFDQLSKLLNRNSGKSKINAYLASHTTKRAALALIDINKFKSINDGYGHPIGDQVLVGLSNFLQTLPVNKYGFFTRLGGDEFVFIIKKYVEKNDENVVKDQINSYMLELGKKLNILEPLGVSIGTSVYPTDGLTFDSLYAIADEAMYIEKKKMD